MAARTKILLIGAGPTGLALAVSLRQRGIDFRIVDRLEAGQNTSRAGVVHARTLEVLEELGVVEALRADGIEVQNFVLRDRGHALARISFAEIPSAYPFVLMIPQNRTEFHLESRLHELGARVERGFELQSWEASANGVRATIAREGRNEVVEAEYIVACDGMHSRVREGAKIPFEGKAYDQSFVLADIRMEWPLAREEVSLFLAPAGLVVVAPLPNDRFRVVATMDEAPAEPSAADVTEILALRGPPSPLSIKELLWSSRFRVHHRLAGALVKGRVILVGDAAHVHSPAGGQGMNLGIRDAVSLAAALAEGSAASLVAWERARRRQAKSVVALTDRLTRVATMKNPLARIIRNLVVASLLRARPLARRITHSLAGLSDR